MSQVGTAIAAYLSARWQVFDRMESNDGWDLVFHIRDDGWIPPEFCRARRHCYARSLSTAVAEASKMLPNHDEPIAYRVADVVRRHSRLIEDFQIQALDHAWHTMPTAPGSLARGYSIGVVT